MANPDRFSAVSRRERHACVFQLHEGDGFLPQVSSLPRLHLQTYIRRASQNLHVNTNRPDPGFVALLGPVPSSTRCLAIRCHAETGVSVPGSCANLQGREQRTSQRPLGLACYQLLPLSLLAPSGEHAPSSVCNARGLSASCVLEASYRQ